ncbi:MAG: hypothetical protein V1866_00280 [archaeon]
MAGPELFQKPPGPQAHQKKQPVSPELFEKLAKDVNTTAANLRIMEERYALMRNKSQLSEQSIIDLDRGATKDIKLLSDDMTELKHELRDILDKVRLIDEEMHNLVDKNEFRVIERYVDMWQPMSFVTRNELNKIIEEKKGGK